MIKFNVIFILCCCFLSSAFSNEDFQRNNLERQFGGFLNYFSMGDHTGNGGDIVICNNGSKKTYRILDYYEVEELHFLKPKLSGQHDKEAYLKILTERLGNGLQKNYFNRAQNFMNRVVWTNNELQDIPDSKHTYIPSNCSLKQIAVNHLNGQVTIRRDLWDTMGQLNQAVLIMHELMYEDAILSGHKNSVATRLALSHIIAESRAVDFIGEVLKEVENLNEYDLRGVLRFTPLMTVKFKSLDIILRNFDLDEDLKAYLLSFAKSKNYGFVYSLFSNLYSNRLQEKYRDFMEAYIIENLEYLKSVNNLKWKSIKRAFEYIDKEHRELTDKNFSTIGEIFIKTEFNRAAYYDALSIAKIMIRNSHLINQSMLDRILVSSSAGQIAPSLFSEILESMPLYLRFPQSFTSSYFDRIKKIVADRYYLPQDSHFTFFISRGLYVSEIINIFKKLTIDRRSVSSDWNSPFFWTLSKRREILYPLAEELKEELKQAAMYAPKINSYPRPLKAYYDRFNGATEPEHVDHIIKIYLSDRDDYEGRSLLEWLIVERGEQTEKVQGVVAHGVRFSSEIFRKKENIRLLGEFKSFTSLTHSILELELKKYIDEPNFIIEILRLYLNREFNSDLRLVFERLLSHPNEGVAKLALDILS